MPYKQWVAGEILTASDVNSFLGSQAISVFADATARNAAITSPVEGQFAFRTDDDVLEYWDGSAWEEYSTGFAKISDTPTGTYTDGGIDYAYWTFNSNGSLTVTKAGFLDILVVGGGGGGARASNATGGAGGGGGLRYGIFSVDPATYTVTVGAGGTGITSDIGTAGTGTASSFGTVLVGGGGGPGRQGNKDGFGGGGSGGGDNAGTGDQRGGGGQLATGFGQIDGITLNYNGSATEYGRGGTVSNSTPPANVGHGGNLSSVQAGADGGSGRVILRVRL